MREPRVVSENELAYLWEHRRSKAIDIILNNSTYPDAIDDFKHESSRFYAVFLDFRDAFGSLPHSVMLHSLEEIKLPEQYIHIIKNVYDNSFLQVICGHQLTKPVKLEVGIKTGCPWSAVNFILALNHWLKWLCLLAPPGITSPNPVQAFADDVLIVSREENVITNMLSYTDRFLQWSGLEVKNNKCAVFYERQSGGNRWYKAKYDQPPSFIIAGSSIRVYSRHESYNYLGHMFNVAGEWHEQVSDICKEYSSRLDLIDQCPLPTCMKLQAVRDIALSKIHHLFANVHIAKKYLTELNNKTVQLVRKWLSLNTHTTRSIIFMNKSEGGLGIPNTEWIYTATRVKHLLHMLNNDDPTVREVARRSLLLDLNKRKVPYAADGEPGFLGFRKKPSGKLDTRATGFGVRSDWPDLNDLCSNNNIQLNWAHTGGEQVNISQGQIMDPNVYAEASIHHTGTSERLNSRTCRYEILQYFQAQQRDYWVNLRLQGKLACLQSADHTVSHSALQNSAVNEDILKFVIKARLQTLPTKYNLSLWFPKHHEPFCLLHSDKVMESTAHILNGCPAFKGLYIARHDRIVNITAQELRKVSGQSAIHTNKTVKTSWFLNLNDNNINSLRSVLREYPNTPDIVVIDELSKNILILEVGCCFDLYMDLCFSEKMLKYQSLTNALAVCGYRIKLIILIFGSLGHVHRLCVRGLQIAGLSKKTSKQTARYCSVSAIIGSLHVWRRRCHLYP